MIIKIIPARAPAMAGTAAAPAAPKRASDAQLGRSMKNLVTYLVGPGKANEHTNPTMIAGWDMLPEEFADVTWNDPDWGPGEVSRLAAQLNRPMIKKRVDHELPDDRAWVMHVTMSLEPGSTLTYEQWGSVARDYIRHMDLDDSGGKAPCRWVGFHHGLSAGQADSDSGQDHIHLAVMMIREDGTWASTWQNQRRTQQARRQIEADHELIAAEDAARTKDRVPYTAVDAVRSGRGEPTERDRLRSSMTAALTQADSEADYIRRLWASGVLTRPRFAQGTDEVVTGYSVALRPTTDQQPIFHAAGKVHKSLTLTNVRARFTDSPEAAQRAALLWRAGSAVTHTQPGPARAKPRRTVTQAAAEIAEVNRIIKDLPQAEIDKWADVAYDTSGIWATVSATLEPSRTGPITAAAEATLRDATTVATKDATIGDTTQPMRRAQFNLQTARAARLIAQSWRDDELGWLAVLEQLGHTTAMIARARAARGDATNAEYLATRASAAAEAAQRAVISLQNQGGGARRGIAVLDRSRDALPNRDDRGERE